MSAAADQFQTQGSALASLRDSLQRYIGQKHSKETTVQPDSREYEIRIWYSAEKGNECFIAQVVEWPGIMAHGDTREEAARQIQLALEGALEVAAERGLKPQKNVTGDM